MATCGCVYIVDYRRLSADRDCGSTRIFQEETPQTDELRCSIRFSESQNPGVVSYFWRPASTCISYDQVVLKESPVLKPAHVLRTYTSYTNCIMVIVAKRRVVWREGCSHRPCEIAVCTSVLQTYEWSIREWLLIEKNSSSRAGSAEIKLWCTGESKNCCALWRR